MATTAPHPDADERVVPVLPEGEFPSAGAIVAYMGSISETLLDASDSITSVAISAERAKRDGPGPTLNDAQAGALLLRARFYRELVEGITESLERLEEAAYDNSFFGSPD